MTNPLASIHQLAPSDIEAHLDDLCRILIDSVEEGAAISFLSPLSRHDAAQFWLGSVKQALTAGATILFGAFIEDRLIGTVQLIIAMPPNQPHRAEISKMIVHPDGRRKGIGKALMQTTLTTARQHKKTLITLDTRTGDVSEALYRSVGFQVTGIVPEFALDPDGRTKHATTYMYQLL